MQPPNCNDFPDCPRLSGGNQLSAEIDNNLRSSSHVRSGCPCYQSVEPIGPQLDPLGTRIASSTNRDGNYDLYSQARCSDLQRITNNASSDRSLIGRQNQIAFSSG